MKRISVRSVRGGGVYRRADAFAAAGVDEAASPIFGVKIPPGYREWTVISVAHEAGNNNGLRAILGNDVAIKPTGKGGYPTRTAPSLPDWPGGTFRLRKTTKSLQCPLPFAGAPINLQLSVKDSRKYASTGGWGFAQFKDGKPADAAVQEPAFPVTSLPKLATLSTRITHPHLDTINR